MHIWHPSAPVPYSPRFNNLELSDIARVQVEKRENPTSVKLDLNRLQTISHVVYHVRTPRAMRYPPFQKIKRAQDGREPVKLSFSKKSHFTNYTAIDQPNRVRINTVLIPTSIWVVSDPRRLIKSDYNWRDRQKHQSTPFRWCRFRKTTRSLYGLIPTPGMVQSTVYVLGTSLGEIPKFETI